MNKHHCMQEVTTMLTAQNHRKNPPPESFSPISSEAKPSMATRPTKSSFFCNTICLEINAAGSVQIHGHYSENCACRTSAQNCEILLSPSNANLLQSRAGAGIQQSKGEEASCTLVKPKPRSSMPKNLCSRTQHI